MTLHLPLRAVKPTESVVALARHDAIVARHAIETRWRELSLPQVEALVRRITILERQCRPLSLPAPKAPKHKRLQYRLRQRRLQLSAALARIGCRVHPLMFRRSLPPRGDWPGYISLVRCSGVQPRHEP